MQVLRQFDDAEWGSRLVSDGKDSALGVLLLGIQGQFVDVSAGLNQRVLLVVAIPLLSVSPSLSISPVAHPMPQPLDSRHFAEVPLGVGVGFVAEEAVGCLWRVSV